MLHKFYDNIHRKVCIALVSLTVSFAAMFVASPATRVLIKQRKNPAVGEYTRKHLAEIIAEQEQKIGITHFGVPDITFSVPAELEFRTFIPGDSLRGVYEPCTDRVYILPGVHTTPEHQTIERNIIAFLTCGRLRLENVRNTLDHELGHFYMDKLSECIGRGDWPSDCYTDSFETNMCLRMISKGCATYFEKTMNDGSDDFTDDEYPENLYELDARTIYAGGYHFVKPIIDSYGSRALEYFVMNPPDEEAILNLKEYQQRIIDELAE